MKLTFCLNLGTTFVQLTTFVHFAIFKLDQCKLYKNGLKLCGNIGLADCEDSTFSGVGKYRVECPLNTAEEIIITSALQLATDPLPTATCLGKHGSFAIAQLILYYVCKVSPLEIDYEGFGFPSGSNLSRSTG